jgi:hypothetical protein
MGLAAKEVKKKTKLESIFHGKALAPLEGKKMDSNVTEGDNSTAMVIGPTAAAVASAGNGDNPKMMQDISTNEGSKDLNYSGPNSNNNSMTMVPAPAPVAHGESLAPMEGVSGYDSTGNLNLHPPNSNNSMTMVPAPVDNSTNTNLHPPNSNNSSVAGTGRRHEGSGR